MISWRRSSVQHTAEAAVFRAFVVLDQDELRREQIIDTLDVMGRGKDTRVQTRTISRLDSALSRLIAQRRLVRVRKGVFSVVGREA